MKKELKKKNSMGLSAAVTKATLRRRAFSTTTSRQQQQPGIKTRVTEILQCQYPIILPGMSWISTPELVAAVSNAGGIGILATGPLNDIETRLSIQRIRELLKPIGPNHCLPKFGIGATLLMPGAVDNAKVALDEQVPIINVSLGKPDWIAKHVHEYGGHLISTITNRKHANAAIDNGADILMVTGHEAAAHGGDVTSTVLIPSIHEQFPTIPLIAAGGFATGRGLAGALCLGADAVAMGSRFAVSYESPLAESIKLAIVQHNENDTIYGSNFDGIPARVLKTSLADQLMTNKPFIGTVIYRAFNAAQSMNIPLWKVLPGLLTQWKQMYMIAQFGAASQRLMAATVDGDINNGVQFIGQSQGMINDIVSVSEIVQRIIQEAKDVSISNAEKFNSNV
jgi:enoyl-[acyl-carrier protein] reductase II